MSAFKTLRIGNVVISTSPSYGAVPTPLSTKRRP